MRSARSRARTKRGDAVVHLLQAGPHAGGDALIQLALGLRATRTTRLVERRDLAVDDGVARGDDAPLRLGDVLAKRTFATRFVGLRLLDARATGTLEVGQIDRERRLRLGRSLRSNGARGLLAGLGRLILLHRGGILALRRGGLLDQAAQDLAVALDHRRPDGHRVRRRLLEQPIERVARLARERVGDLLELRVELRAGAREAAIGEGSELIHRARGLVVEARPDGTGRGLDVGLELLDLRRNDRVRTGLQALTRGTTAGDAESDDDGEEQLGENPHVTMLTFKGPGRRDNLR
jgi:hypothetical protein